MTTTIESLTGLEFRRNVPSALRKAGQRGHADNFQKAMTNQHRTARKRLKKAIVSAEASILWSAGGIGHSAADRELTTLLSGSRKQRQAARKLAVQAVVDGECRPLVVLTGIDTLVQYGRDLSESDYAALYCSLARIDEIAPDQEISDEQDRLIVRLICEGELPLLLSFVLGELKGQARRFKASAKVLREGLDAGTDTDGMLHASLTSRADAWLAPLVRSAHWGAAFENSWLTARDTEQFADAARTCALLLVQTGLVSRPPATLREIEQSAADVVDHALRAVGIRDSSPFSALARSHSQCKRGTSPKKVRSAEIETSNQSDWAESAILRSGLQVDADLCVVNWDEPAASIHLAVLGTPLLSGSWTSEVIVNGETIGPVEGWGCSCWFSDKEAAFVELEADPTDSIHVVRHVMLSLKDRIGIFCESVTTTDSDATVRLSNQLPLAAKPLAVVNSITREIALHADCVSTRVIPAWLEDDRVQHAIGRCEKIDDELVSEGEGLGGAIIPLVFDWHPERQALDADWNRLTVTEDRAVVSTQNAAGFRVRIGKQQLLIYRSLRPGDFPRAVMGLHTLNETVYGRVKKSGEVAPLVLVDG
jgi:hypothetical protein